MVELDIAANTAKENLVSQDICQPTSEPCIQVLANNKYEACMLFLFIILLLILWIFICLCGYRICLQ